MNGWGVQKQKWASRWGQQRHLLAGRGCTSSSSCSCCTCLEVKHKALQGEAEHGGQGTQLQLPRGVHLQQEGGQWWHQISGSLGLWPPNWVL